jgi:polysaccharide pyruvyl transferase WcaK-like protein
VMKNLLIVGNYGAQNFGDDAMLAVLVHHLRRHFRLTVFSVLRRKLVEKEFGVASVSVLTPVRLLSEMRKADFVLVGGGSLIKNLSMVKLAPILLLSILMRKPRVFFGVEVHRLNFVIKAFFAAVCRDAIMICTRNALASNGMVFKCRMMPDLAYGLVAMDKFAQRRLEVGQSIVGVNVRPSTPTDPFDSESWRTRVADFLEELAPRKILLFPFQPCDRKEIAKLVRSLRMRRLRSRIRIVNATSFGQALEEMRGISLAIGMRLHFLVFASLLSVPFIAVPYHQKVVRFANSVDAPVLSTSSNGPIGLGIESVLDKSRQVLDTIRYLVSSLNSAQAPPITEVPSPLTIIHQ